MARIAEGNAARSPRKAMAITLARAVFFLVPITIRLMLVCRSMCNFLVMKSMACPSPKVTVMAMMATLSKMSGWVKKTWRFRPMMVKIVMK